MKLSICSTTANRQFVKALRRQQPDIDELKRRFASVEIDGCPHEILMLAFVDRDADSWTIVSGSKEIFEVEAGYAFQDEYPQGEDVLVVQLLEEKLSQTIRACDGLGSAQTTLLRLLEDWTTEVVTR